MVGVLQSPKNVFWEALILTVVVFVFGLFLGLALEKSRISDINDYYVSSEISLIDTLALNDATSFENTSCSDLILGNLLFADKIYIESKILEDYEEANKLSDSLKLVHKRYDLLRTLLWINANNVKLQCKGDFSVVVYLYERETTDLAQKASQNVWSKVLKDFKEEEGANIVLIPIATDSDLSSLRVIVSRYDLDSYPVVIVNDQVIDQLKSVQGLKEYIDKS
ncbi:MAG TPA: hypothetical protein VJH92_06365 [Candidatus Nanoarchaeia archaeon]|nr:hypothetical protein [Candidatus Nanoarchaeia archaeon]